MALIELSLLGYALTSAKDHLPEVVACLTFGLVVIGLFTLITGRGIPHFRSRFKAAAIIDRSGCGNLNSLGKWIFRGAAA